MLRDLGLYHPSPPTLRCDNIGATYLSANPAFDARTKHIEIDFHFIHDKVASKTENFGFLFYLLQRDIGHCLTLLLPHVHQAQHHVPYVLLAGRNEPSTISKENHSSTSQPNKHTTANTISRRKSNQLIASTYDKINSYLKTEDVILKSCYNF
jgi:hypothetical protein